MGYPGGSGWYDGGRNGVLADLFCCFAPRQHQRGHDARTRSHHQRCVCTVQATALSTNCMVSILDWHVQCHFWLKAPYREVREEVAVGDKHTGLSASSQQEGQLLAHPLAVSGSFIRCCMLGAPEVQARCSISEPAGAAWILVKGLRMVPS